MERRHEEGRCRLEGAGRISLGPEMTPFRSESAPKGFAPTSNRFSLSSRSPRTLPGRFETTSLRNGATSRRDAVSLGRNEARPRGSDALSNEGSRWPCRIVPASNGVGPTPSHVSSLPNAASLFRVAFSLSPALPGPPEWSRGGPTMVHSLVIEIIEENDAAAPFATGTPGALRWVVPCSYGRLGAAAQGALCSNTFRRTS
jgi:hypothetical protein